MFMKRSDILFWLVLILLAALLFWLITTGRLQFMANQVVDGIWKFVQNIGNLRLRK